MRNTTTLLAAVLAATNLFGQTTDPASWQNLSRLAPGQSIQVATDYYNTAYGVKFFDISLMRLP